MELFKELRDYEELLLQLKNRLTKEEKHQPKGILRAYRHRNSFQYFVRENEKDLKGKYIKQKDMEKASLLAQKEYNNLLKKEVEIELQKLKDFEKEISGKLPWERTAEKMIEAKKVLIQVPVISDEEYILKWHKQEYAGVPFRENAPEFYTKKGERVRSKTEIILADLLAEYEVPYLYERPVKLKGNIITHPDFTVLRVKDKKEIIWEHFGMMDDIEYRNNAFKKIRDYENSGYVMGSNFIFTFETSKNPIDVTAIRRMIEGIFI
ncbi:MAG: hypothetical protein K5773_03520 [Pseudobutyrivibrio sp.]|nr:hypothetical protein [Pseudobutyrivibrio sp.]